MSKEYEWKIVYWMSIYECQFHIICLFKKWYQILSVILMSFWCRFYDKFLHEMHIIYHAEIQNRTLMPIRYCNIKTMSKWYRVLPGKCSPHRPQLIHSFSWSCSNVHEKWIFEVNVSVMSAWEKRRKEIWLNSFHCQQRVFARYLWFRSKSKKIAVRDVFKYVLIGLESL